MSAIPIQKIIDKIRGKKEGQKKNLVKGGNNKYNPNIKCKLLRVVGDNNDLQIDESVNLNGFSIDIYGHNNTVIIASNVVLNGNLTIGTPHHNECSGCFVSIGESTTANSIFIIMMEPKTSVKIGSDCLISENVYVFASDTHSVIDLDGNLLNYGKEVFIGDHCWIGQDVKIGKSAYIANNSIVSFGSIVKEKFMQENIVIGGNPAKGVRENISWDRKSPYNYIQSQKN